MNVIRIYGGLGNQFFQYAFGLAMMKRGTKVVFDNAWYDRYGERPFLLKHFNITELPLTRHHKIVSTIHENGKYDVEYLKRDQIKFVGYWQNLGYFNHLQPQLRVLFTLADKNHTPEYLNALNQIKNSNSVAVHVRRGDYVGKVNLCPVDYYNRALENFPNHRVFMFTDDACWVKRNLKFDELIHMSPEQDWELMKNCKHQVIANSTFSWWAAWLNDNPEKKVIAPRQWRYTARERIDIEDTNLNFENIVLYDTEKF